MWHLGLICYLCRWLQQAPFPIFATSLTPQSQGKVTTLLCLPPKRHFSVVFQHMQPKMTGSRAVLKQSHPSPPLPPPPSVAHPQVRPPLRGTHASPLPQSKDTSNAQACSFPP
eukprot:EG_transcript_43586